MNDFDLLPCPFCGDTYITVEQSDFMLPRYRYRWRVGCNTIGCPCCHAYIQGVFSAREDAIERWNRRPE